VICHAPSCVPAVLYAGRAAGAIIDAIERLVRANGEASLFIIMIRRFVRSDREEQFLDRYRSQISTDPAFHGETLTRLSAGDGLPAGLTGMLEPRPDCINYLNIARWTDWRPFMGQCDLSENDFDSEIEVAPRERLVVEVIDEVPSGAGDPM
jgi:hypothetical protein